MRLVETIARQHRPTMILADLHLPDISGEDVLREVRADPALSDTPLTKPLDVQELLAKVDAWCNASGPA